MLNETLSETNIRLKIRTSAVELEYEGNEKFISGELLNFLTKIKETFQIPLNSRKGNHDEKEGDAPELNLSIKSIASKLNVSTGSELLLASCVYLTLVSKKDSFSRKDILDTMKIATTFYKKNYGGNLSSYIDVLVKGGKILEQANDLYALQEQTKGEMNAKLDN